MFLFQKFEYSVMLLDTQEKVDLAVKELQLYQNKSFLCYDTETTGLNVMTDTPFLFIYGFGKNIYILDLYHNKPFADLALDSLYKEFENYGLLFAHNAQYDLHMMINYGKEFQKEIKLADSSTVFRLTTRTDSMEDRSLESIGAQHVDSNSKFAGKVIKARIAKLNKERKRATFEAYKDKYLDKRRTTYTGVAFGKVWELYGKRVQFIKHEYDEYFDFIDTVYQEANYLDVYLEDPNLMLAYAADDVVIMLEWLKKAIPVMAETDPGFTVFNRECKLVRIANRMERQGLLVDVEYLKRARDSVMNYRELLYNELHELTGVEDLTASKHKVIKEVFAQKYGIIMLGANEGALSEITRPDKNGNINHQAKRVAEVIIELRTLDKWLGTYINGMLNRVVNGRVHPRLDQSRTITGRIASDMQQQPKYPLYSADGVELFSPRRVFIVDEGTRLYYLDFSQHELRVQAYFTLLNGEGDLNLCRAYMPYQCHSFVTGQPFDYKNPEVLKLWDSGEWVLNENPDEFWKPTDVHGATAKIAFPQLIELEKFDEGTPERKRYDHLRGLGKMCNFLKNYGGGKGAIMSQLHAEDGSPIDEATATTLDNAYYEAFPKILVFQQELMKEVSLKGYVENLYGRRYYMQNQNFYYKLANYMVQGSCADMVKTIEIKLAEFLEDKETEMIMPIHDEIVFRIPDHERHLIPQIKAIMLGDPTVAYLPMAVDVEYSDHNWGEIHTETEWN